MVDKNQFGLCIQVPAKSCMTQPWPHLPAVVHLVKTFLGGEKESGEKKEKKMEVCPKAVRGNIMRLFVPIKLSWLLIFSLNNLYIEATGRQHGWALGLLKDSLHRAGLCVCVRVLKTKRPDYLTVS